MRGHEVAREERSGAERTPPPNPHLLFLATWRWLLPHSQAPYRCRAENGVLHASQVAKKRRWGVRGAEFTPPPGSWLRPAFALIALLAAAPALAQEGAVGALLQQGRYWQEQNRPDLALRSFERALAVDAANPDALAGAIAAQAALGNRGAAEALMARLRQAAPQDPRTARAAEALRGAGADREGIAEARRLAQAGRNAEAVARYREAFGGGAPPESLAAEYHLTLAGTDAGYAEGRDGLAALARANPANQRAQLAYAQALTWREGSRAEGIDRLRLLARDPQLAQQATAAWRQALQWQGATPQAIPALEAFLAARPGDPAIAQLLEQARDPRQAQADAAGQLRQQGFSQLEANRLRDAARQFEDALRANPDDADALGGLGLVRLREGRAAEARDLLERAIAAAPARADQWRRALDGAAYTVETADARAAFRRGDLDAAEALLRRAVAREAADRSDAEALLGDIALRRGDAAGAEQRYRAALARRPGYQPALEGLATALRRQNRLAEAEAVARLLPRGPATPGTGGRAAQLRADAARNTDPATRAALLGAALAEAPNDPWIRLDLARALRAQGRTREARAIVEEPLTRGGGAEAVFAAALFAEEDNRLADAGALIERIPPRLRSPDMARLAARTRLAAEVARAADLARAGSFEARQSLLSLAARQDPTGATAAAVVRGFARNRDPRGAEEAARVALAVDRTPSPEARLALAGALLEAGLETQAAALARGLETEPRLTADARRQAASLETGIAVRSADRLNERGEQAEAFDRLQPVLARDPSDMAANLALARLYQGAHQPREAQRIAEAMLARNPGSAEARAAAIDAATAARDWRRAEELVAEARIAAPNDARALLAEARLARAAGDSRRALAVLEQAADLQRVQTYATAMPGFAPSIVDNPFRRGATTPAPPPGDPLAAEIARELAIVQDEAGSRLMASPSLRARSGTSGLDRLSEISAPLEASVAPGGIGGRLSARITPVFLSSGDLSNTPSTLRQFGSNPLAGASGGLAPRSTDASGVAAAIAYRRDWLSLDIGSSPVGFRSTTVLGGIEIAPLIGDSVRLRLTGERRMITDSLLSWAGQRDPLTGTQWGAVSRTGGRGQVEVTAGPATFYAGGGYATLRGENTADNDRVEAGAGVSYAILRNPDEELTTGADLVYFAYDKNLRFFTLGHGGYFSPQSYTALNLPLDYRGRSGNLSYRVGGSIGYAMWREDSAPVFPNDAGLQAQLVAAAARDPTLRTTYAGQSQSGVVGSLRGDVEYALSPELRLGAALRYDRTADWNEARGMLFLRYRLP